jgi:MFS family permease
MNTTPHAEDGNGAAALAPVNKRFIAGLALANLGVWTGFFGPLQVLLAAQVGVLEPLHKEALLGWITGVGALVAMLANPLAGAGSDRTRSRFGRRLPWIVGGAVAGALCLVLLGRQQGMVGMVLGWCAAQLLLNAMLAALNALIPDRVPVEQRALCGAWVGVMQPLGALCGAVLAATAGSVAQGYAGVALLLLLCTAPLPWLVRTSATSVISPTPDPATVTSGWWIDPRMYPDFAWAWLMRFLVNLGNAIGTLYLLYYLRDRLQYPRLFPGQRAEDGLMVLIGLYAAGVIVGALAGGWLSDRLRQRRPVILVASVVMAVALSVLAVSEDWRWVMAAAALEGLGYGAYVAVDLALVSQVLPRAQDRGKDLGLINIASAAPQVVGPAIAALLVTRLGGYPILFLAAAVATLAGGLAVQRVRAVR